MRMYKRIYNIVENQVHSYYMEETVQKNLQAVCFEMVSNTPFLIIPGNSNLFIWNIYRKTVRHYQYTQYAKVVAETKERILGIRFQGDCRVVYDEQVLLSIIPELNVMIDFAKMVRFWERNLNHIFRIEGAHPLLKNSITEIERTNGMVNIENMLEPYGYSMRQLQRIFKQWFGYGPKRYCQYARLLHVISHMQEKQDISVAGIVEHVGYADASHFQREFKQYMGMSPKQFQKQYLGNFLR